MTVTVEGVLDFLILVFLIGTWFWEGNHRRCTVRVTCAHCGTQLPEMPCREHRH